MFIELECYLRQLLAAIQINIVNEFVAIGCRVVVVSTLTEEKIGALWVRIVYNLSLKDLVRGISDVPLTRVKGQMSIIRVKNFVVICPQEDQLFSQKKIERYEQKQSIFSSTFVIGFSCVSLAHPVKQKSKVNAISNFDIRNSVGWPLFAF
ncbi:MAG: hypothetical protein WC415_03095 [Patescibacteria group bacterium]|jgi:hypothetical protein